MATKDYEGVVTSVAVPIRDLADIKPCFIFGMENPTYQPPGTYPGNVPVFYVALEHPFAKHIMTLVMAAFELGVDVQVGLIPNQGMHVEWVQLPRSPVGKATA